MLVRIDHANIDTNTYTDTNMYTNTNILILILLLHNNILCYFIGILPLILLTESGVKFSRSIPELNSALKGLPFAPLAPSAAQILFLIIFILSLIVVLLFMHMSYKSNKRTERKIHGGYEYPVNCVHGYVNLDAAGNLLHEDSTLPPR